ncbi:hypothetical protein FRB96_000952 [Tulasnella sp. 330]|nr:hypothetical protein FRB96_000952 [Tulasnella sp. 330]
MWDGASEQETELEEIWKAFLGWTDNDKQEEKEEKETHVAQNNAQPEDLRSQVGGTSSPPKATPNNQNLRPLTLFSGMPPEVPLSSSPLPIAKATNLLASNMKQIQDSKKGYEAPVPASTVNAIPIDHNPLKTSRLAATQRERSLRLLQAYLLCGRSFAFNGLAAVPQFSSVPDLGLAIAAATQIISIAQSMPKHSRGLQDLLDRTSVLIIAVVTPFIGTEQFPKRVRLQSIQQLARVLTIVANEIRMIKADITCRHISSAVETVLTYKVVQNRITGCSLKLDWAMRVFQASPLGEP